MLCEPLVNIHFNLFPPLQALSKALTDDELMYIRCQFNLLDPNNDGYISLEHLKKVSSLIHFIL